MASVRVRLKVLVGLKGDDEFLARARVFERRGRIRVMLMRLFLGVERWLFFRQGKGQRGLLVCCCFKVVVGR